jgi:hypothetical protein
MFGGNFAYTEASSVLQGDRERQKDEIVMRRRRQRILRKIMFKQRDAFATRFNLIEL